MVGGPRLPPAPPRGARGLSGRRPGLRRRRGALLLAGALLVGCHAAAPEPTASELSPDPLWRTCPFGECTEIAVPLDHADPNGPTLLLAVARRPATAPRAGTIFTNPGGPGVSGREWLLSFPRDGLEAYDIVSWDPRGVGGSAGLTCLSGRDTDAQLALDSSPDTPEERTALLDAVSDFQDGCRSAAGALLGHLSTQDNARDLEILRQRLDDRPLRYVGFSYGTLLGAVYADMFGEHVGQMVLDAAAEVRPGQVPQAVAFDRALAALGPDTVASVTALLAALDEHPLTVGERRLTSSLGALGVTALLYAGDPGWPALREGVAQARAGDGRALLAAADSITGRNRDGSYSGLFSSFRAIRCADDPHPTVERAETAWAGVVREAPVLGAALGPDYDCVGWPTPEQPRLVVTGARVTQPILVIGTTGDPATPYEWSQALAEDLTTGVLITVTGHGHTAFGRGLACVDDTVVAHLTAPGSGFTPESKHC